jgi:hypothetical protein
MHVVRQPDGNTSYVRILYLDESKRHFSMKTGFFASSFTDEGCGRRQKERCNFTKISFVHRSLKVMVEHLKEE